MRKRVRPTRTRTSEQVPPLSKAWQREIKRRIKDSDDPRRYVIVSVLLPRGRRPWELFYDVSTDCWAMDLSGATLFKRKKTAQAVADVLGDRYKLEQVRVTKAGKIIRIAARRTVRRG